MDASDFSTRLREALQSRDRAALEALREQVTRENVPFDDPAVLRQFRLGIPGLEPPPLATLFAPAAERPLKELPTTVEPQADPPPLDTHAVYLDCGPQAAA